MNITGFSRQSRSLDDDIQRTELVLTTNNIKRCYVLDYDHWKEIGYETSCQGAVIARYRHNHAPKISITVKQCQGKPSIEEEVDNVLIFLGMPEKLWKQIATQIAEIC